jgi:predicted nucleic acid-binding protein
VIYGSVTNPRGREADIAIAACAIVHDAAIWTLNDDDFKEVPGLELV